jgi:poly-gamma-glutamate synthesis protein (capsule biosynthesis protein)
MGNMISNQRSRYRDGGILVELTLNKDGSRISDHAYLPVWVWKPATKKGTGFTLVPANADPAAAFLSSMSPQDRYKMELFLQDTRLQMKGRREVIAP